MATNEILPFAETDTGTNLLTQAAYLADSQRPIGNQPGVARSNLVNKALRQTSLIAAGVAQFLADTQANNITDSRTPAEIATYLRAVTASLAANTFIGTQTLSGTAINEARSNVAQHATTMDFWAAAVGNVLDGTGTVVTITAIANAPQAGASRDFYPLTGTVLTQGSTFDIDGAVSRTSEAGECWTFVAKSVSTYRVFVRKADGTAVVSTSVASTAEAQAQTSNNKIITPLSLKEALQGANQSLASSGYQKMPGGMIIQWGVAAFSAGTSVAVTFPIAFPTALYTITDSAAINATRYISALSVSGFTANIGTSSSGGYYWIAIGK